MTIRQTTRAGYTLMETVVTIFVVLILTALLTSLVTLRGFNRQTAHRAAAAALADEEINALRRLDVTTLAAQTNGPPRNVLSNAGRWQVVADASQPASHSAPNVVALTASSASGETGRLLLPDGTYGSLTVSAKWLVNSTSPAGWAIGYWLHARDARDGYRLRLAAASTDLDSGTVGVQNALLEIVSAGTVSRLTSAAAATATTGAWLTLQVVVGADNQISFSLNGTQIFSATDAAFLTGPAALLGWGGVQAEVDDVTVTTASPATWNFDAETTLPAAWTRFGLNDLPDATPTTFDDNLGLTIAPYPIANATTLKQATVTITWLESGAARSYTTATLLGQSGIGR